MIVGKKESPPDIESNMSEPITVELLSQTVRQIVREENELAEKLRQKVKADRKSQKVLDRYDARGALAAMRREP